MSITCMAMDYGEDVVSILWKKTSSVLLIGLTGYD